MLQLPPHIGTLVGRHFAPELESKHGEGTCGAPKSRFRLRRACEKLKKMLSTLDETQVWLSQGLGFFFARGFIMIRTTSDLDVH